MALALDSKIQSKMENDGNETDSNTSNRRQHVVVGTVVLVCSVFLFLWSASSTTDSFSDPVDIVVRKTRIVRRGEDQMKCMKLCAARRAERSNHFFGSGTTEINSNSNNDNRTTTPTKDFIDADREDIVNLIKSAKERLLTKLRTDYGEKYFEDIYVDAEGRYRPFYPITPDGDSWSILKRKLMIKILSAQVTSKQQESNVDGICDCLTNKALSATAGRRRLEADSGGNGDSSITTDKALEEPDKPDDSDVPVSSAVKTIFERYVWSTGGHSAAAAHGNMFNESYTSYMESDLVDVFASVGIEFEGRNYAMGGTGSAAEIAMCWEEIFGTDVDIFSWDYGMTGKKDAAKD